MRTLPILATFCLTGLAAAQFHAGNLVVLRVGDGLNPLSNASQALFLDEYTTGGVLVQSLALPTAVNGTNLPIACSGSATSEGNLQLSGDGRFLVLGGYATPPGLVSVASTASASTPRVIARVGIDGSVDTSTSLTNLYSANNLRSATSLDGTAFWTAGANSGIGYVALGASTGVSLNVVNPQNNRVVSIQNGQLHVSGSAQGFYGVSAVGTGLPTTTGQVVTALPGMPTAAGPSAYDFFFADANTLYVADDRASGGNGGIQKYTFANGTWSLQYTLSPTATSGCRGVTGVVLGGVVTLFATDTLSSNDQLLSVVDTGPGATFQTLATAGTYTLFRGVRLLAGSPFVQRTPNGCGAVSIVGSGDAALGSTFTTDLGNTTGVPFVGYGLVLAPTPICSSCVLGHEWSVALFGGTSGFGIPNDAAFAGLLIGIQGADLLGTGGCANPPVVMTDTLAITLH